MSRLPPIALVALLLAGCLVAPEPPMATSSTQGGTTSSTSPPASTTWPQTSTPRHCGPTTTARWIEEGVHSRAVSVGFPKRGPRDGFPVSAEARSRFGDANITYASIGVGNTGLTGKTQELVLTHFQSQFRGSFREGTSRSDVRNEYLAFARRVLTVSESTLEAQADAFASNKTLDGSHRLSVAGPFKVGAFLDEFRAGANERWLGVDFLAIEASSGAAGVATVTWERDGLRLNRLDWVEHSAPGHKSQVWASANATFDQLGWPRPDLSDALVSTVVC